MGADVDAGEQVDA